MGANEWIPLGTGCHMVPLCMHCATLIHPLILLPPPKAITSCASGTTGCNNCNGCGGSPIQGFTYVQSNGGLASGASYPFVGLTGTAPLPSIDTDACNAALQSQVGQSLSELVKTWALSR